MDIHDGALILTALSLIWHGGMTYQMLRDHDKTLKDHENRLRVFEGKPRLEGSK